MYNLLFCIHSTHLHTHTHTHIYNKQLVYVSSYTWIDVRLCFYLFFLMLRFEIEIESFTL